MLTAAFGEIFRPPADDSVTLLRVEYENLQELINRLQAAADKYSAIDLKDISECMSMGSAKQLQEDYNTAWFTDSMYSLEVLQEIATSLLDVSEPFLPGNALWIKIAYGIVPSSHVEPERPLPLITKPWEKDKIARAKAKEAQEESATSPLKKTA
jgi:hypothetical protein